MKITKQRLKEIIAEELKGAKNEGIFDFFKKKKKEEPAPEPEPEGPSEKELEAQTIEKIKDTFFLDSDDEKHMRWFRDGYAGLARAFQGKAMDTGHYAADYVADQFDKDPLKYNVGNMSLEDAIAKSIYIVNPQADRSYIKGVVDTLSRAAKDRYEYMTRDTDNRSSSSSRKSGFDKWQSGEGDNYNYMTRMEEGKITKDALKSLIAEELENSQNEGFFGKLKAKMGFGSKNWEPLTDKFEKESKRLYRSHFDMETGAEMAEAVKAMVANFDQYMDALQDEDLTKDQQRGTDAAIRLYKDELSRISARAEQYGARDAKEAAEKAAREAEARAKEQAEYERYERERKRRAAWEKERDEKSRAHMSGRKSGFDKWQSGEGDNYNYMTRMEEGKITKDALKSLIAEELTNIRGKK